MVQIEEFHFCENPSVYLSNFKSNDTRPWTKANLPIHIFSIALDTNLPVFSFKDDLNAIYSNPVGDAKSLRLMSHMQYVEIEGNIESLGTLPRKSYIPKSFYFHSIINPKISP